MSRGYPSDWDHRRSKVYKRDNYACQNCGRTGGPHGNAELHAHHIVPKSKGGTHKTSNLKTLCKGCHNAIHGNKSAPTVKGNSNGNTKPKSNKQAGKAPGLFVVISILFLLIYEPVIGLLFLVSFALCIFLLILLMKKHKFDRGLS